MPAPLLNPSTARASTAGEDSLLNYDQLSNLGDVSAPGRADELLSSIAAAQTLTLPATQNGKHGSAHTYSEATSAAVRRLTGDSPEPVIPWPSRTRSLLGVQIIGSGAYVPPDVITNEDLRSRWGCDPDWIVQRTGIQRRRYAAEGVATSDLCIEAARRALRSAQISPEEVDLVVVGTFTPDYHCPSTANILQSTLGIDAPAFDLAAACSGFVYALATAAQFVATGNSRYALVVGGDTNSRIVDPRDQKVAPLFGDGAGAVILTRGSREQGLVCYQMGSDGSGGAMLDRPSGGTRRPLTHADLDAGKQYLQMDGRGVFKWAVKAVASSMAVVLQGAGLGVQDVDLYLMHQANIRIINNVAEQLGVPVERIVNNLSEYGNTSAASIPLVLDDALQQGRVHRNDLLMLSGFGAGLTWGTCLWKW